MIYGFLYHIYLEFIDNNINGEVSVFSKKLTIDVEKVFCFGSYWYSEFWRSISVPLYLKGLHITYTTFRFHAIMGPQGPNIFNPAAISSNTEKPII